MLKPIVIRSIFVLMLMVVSSVFAEDDENALSTFHQQGGMDYPESVGQEAFYAEKAPMPSRPSGYFGIDFGPNYSSLSSDVAFNGAPGGTQKKGRISYNFGLYGGYGTNFGHFYLGTEAGLGYNFLDRNILNAASGRSILVNLKRPLMVGLDIIPGYLTDAMNVLLYGRLGLGASYTKLSFTDVTPATSQPSDKVNKFNFGLRIGGGIDYFISDGFSFRTEYVYTNYNKVSGDDITVGSNKYSYSIPAASFHQIKFGFAGHF